MKTARLVLLSLLIAAALTAWITWPLGKVCYEGMPSSHRPEAGGPRYMIAGDHLQFLFHLWMLADAMAGKTPLFYHVYEFNEGNDQDRRDPGTYYFPFGVLYAAGYAMGGRAIGWNLMILVTAWLSYLATWLLTRRFCSSALIAAVSALPALLLPYFWACFLGGSPTGPGMLWVPVIFLGVDLAIRDRKVWGGIMAGVALFVSPWVDMHVFFFAFLATPAWMALCLLFTMEKEDDGPIVAWKRWILPVLPVVLLMGCSYLQMAILKRSLAGTLQAGGRSLLESSVFAPTRDGWFAWDPGHPHNQIYIGLVAPAVLLAGLMLLALDAWRAKDSRRAEQRGSRGFRLLLFCLVLAAVVGIALLALGPNIPKDPTHLVWRALRKLIPPYKMIRQPAKVFCILAPFLAVAMAMALSRIQALFARRVWAVGLTLAVAAACIWDYGRRVNPAICLLEHEQGAYRAIAEDAAGCGRENRAMSIPIWPGDSHWNSLTEYYATLHRTKMLNGYNPSVRRQYFTNVFERFDPMSMGAITDDRLDALLAMKIGYLILQEDAYPDKVSPFPVSHTLRELTRHPRIRTLAQDREVWSFKILTATGPRPPRSPDAGPACPLLTTWQWQATDVAAGPAAVLKDAPDADAYVRLSAPDGRLQLPPRTLYPMDGLRYVLSVRGSGTLRGSFGAGLADDAFAVPVSSDSHWSWREIPLPALPDGKETTLAPAITNAAGSLDVGVITLVAGPWKWLQPGETLTVPAAAFFRSGFSDPLRGFVHLSADRTPADVVFYAPVLPMPPGRYRVTVDFDTRAAAGTELGDVSVSRSGEDAGAQSAPIAAGSPAVLDYRHAGFRPLRLDLRYTRKADLTIRSIVWSRVND